MGVGSRTFQTFLCDACGREVIAEEGTPVDGYYIEALQVSQGKSLGTDNIYACSDVCVERAIRDAIKRETLPEEQKLTATQELWLKGQKFRPVPELPVYDAGDETRVIGTAREIANYRPEKSAVDALDPQWRSR